MSDCLKVAVNLFKKIVNPASVTALERIHKPVKRVCLILLVLVVSSLSFLAGSFGRIAKESKPVCVAVCDLPKVSDSFYRMHVDGPPQQEIHILDPGSYVMPALGMTVGLSSNLIVAMLGVIQKDCPWKARVQFWVKADAQFEALWQSIELCATQASNFSLALLVAGSKADKSILQKISGYFIHPIDEVYSKRFTAPVQVQISTNMIVIEYRTNQISVNNSVYSLKELERIVLQCEDRLVVLLVSGKCPVQKVIKMMEEINKRFSCELYLGLLPEKGILNPGSNIRIIETGVW